MNENIPVSIVCNHQFSIASPGYAMYWREERECGCPLFIYERIAYV